MTSNRPIPIKTAKNIVIFINNNAFAHGLTGSIEPSTARRGNVGNKSSNNKGKGTTYFYNNNIDNNNPPDLPEFVVNINPDKLVNIENLIVDIDFLDYHFNDNG